MHADLLSFPQDLLSGQWQRSQTALSVRSVGHFCLRLHFSDWALDGRWELSEGPIPQISKAVRPPLDPLHGNSDQKVSTSSSSCKDDLQISPSTSAQSDRRNLAPAIPSPLISNSSSDKSVLMSQCPFLFEGTEDEGPTPGTEDGEGPRGWWVGKAGGPGDIGGGEQTRTSKKGHVEEGSRTEGGKAGLRRRRRGRPVLSSMDMPVFGPERVGSIVRLSPCRRGADWHCWLTSTGDRGPIYLETAQINHQQGHAGRDLVHDGHWCGRPGGSGAGC